MVLIPSILKSCRWRGWDYDYYGYAGFKCHWSSLKTTQKSSICFYLHMDDLRSSLVLQETSNSPSSGFSEIMIYLKAFDLPNFYQWIDRFIPLHINLRKFLSKLFNLVVSFSFRASSNLTTRNIYTVLIWSNTWTHTFCRNLIWMRWIGFQIARHWSYYNGFFKFIHFVGRNNYTGPGLFISLSCWSNLSKQFGIASTPFFQIFHLQKHHH